MSLVQIYLQTATKYGHLYNIDEARIRAHSVTITNTLGQGNSALTKRVDLTGAAPAALKYILECIKNNKPDKTLHIKVHDLRLEKAVAIYEAAELLNLEPHQPHIEGHIIGYISHNLITSKELITLHRCFYNRQAVSKVWRVIVHQTGWNLVHSKYEYEKAVELKDAATPYQELVDGIDQRINELLPKKEHHDQVKAWEAARKERKAQS